MDAKPIRVLVVQDANSSFRPSLDDEYFKMEPVRPEQLERAILDSKDEPQLVLLRAGDTSKQLSPVLKRIGALAVNVPVVILPDTAADNDVTDTTSKVAASDSKLDGEK